MFVGLQLCAKMFLFCCCISTNKACSNPFHSILRCRPFGRPLCITCTYAGIEIKTANHIICSIGTDEKEWKNCSLFLSIVTNLATKRTYVRFPFHYYYYYYLLSVSIRDKPTESLAEIHWAARFMINRGNQRNSMQAMRSMYIYYTGTGTVKKSSHWLLFTMISICRLLPISIHFI